MIWRFAPPRASSLPLPPSPTGSGAWTYRRGPGDHSTARRTTGIPGNRYPLCAEHGHLFANPNRLAAVRCNQASSTRCVSSQSKSNEAVSLAEKSFSFALPQFPSGTSRPRAPRRFTPPRASWGAPARSGASRRPARRRSRSLHPQLVAVLGHAGAALVTMAHLGLLRGYRTGIRTAPSMGTSC